MRLFKRQHLIYVIIIALITLSSACLGSAIDIYANSKKLQFSSSAELINGEACAPVSILDSLGVIYHPSSKTGFINMSTPSGETSEIHTFSHSATEYVKVGEVMSFLGAQSSWNENKTVLKLIPSVKAINLTQNSLSVRLSFPVKYTLSNWNKKLIIDIPDSRFSQDITKSPTIDVSSDYVDRIRTGMYSKESCRIVLDLKESVAHSVQSKAEASEIQLTIGSSAQPSTIPAQQTPASPLYKLNSTEIWDVDGTSFDLSINTSARGKVSSKIDTAGGKVTLILAGATLGDNFTKPGTVPTVADSINFTQIDGKVPSVRVDIALNRVMRVETVVYDGSIVASFRTYKQASGNISDKVFVVDPGHGGSQKGAVCSSVYEKDINLAIARKLTAALRQTGATVIMTHDDDVTMDLASRPQVAIDNSASFFISIHCNSNAFANSIAGTEVYYHGGNSNSMYLANVVQKAVCKSSGMINRGSRSDKHNAQSSGFKVLRLLDGTNIPAILVECGYVNHSSDRKKLLNPASQDKIADGIVKGIEAYIAGKKID